MENSAIASCLLEEEHHSEKIVYLNNAEQSRLSAKVQRSGLTSIQASPVAPHADEDQRRIRSLFASLIDAEESEIAIHPSTAFAVTLAAENVYAQLPRNGSFNNDSSCTSPQQILIVQDQMNSAVYPWQNICKRSGGKLKLAVVAYPTQRENGWTEAILERLDNSVVVACLPPLHWSDGSIIDLSKISQKCQELSIMLIVDSTQATGIHKCSVKEIQPAMMACSVHKWIRAPSGTSLVYINKGLHSRWMPLDQHGRGRDFADGAEWDASKYEMGPTGYEEKFFEDARKFDAGGKPNPILLPMLRAALEEVVFLDINRAQEHLKMLMAPLIEWARSHDCELTLGPHAYHIVGIRPPKHITPHQMVKIATQLQQEEGIYIAVRCGAFRVSPYIDNKEEDIEKLIDALSKRI